MLLRLHNEQRPEILQNRLMGRMLNYGIGLVAIIFLTGYGFESCASNRYQAESIEQRRVADSLGAEMSAERLRLEGYSVLIQENSPESLLAALDSIPLLRDELASAHINITSLSSISIHADGEIEQVVDTVIVFADNDSIARVQVEDSVLVANISFEYVPKLFGLEYLLKPQKIDIIQGITGDNRLWTSVSSPHLEVVIDTVFADIPQPMVIKKNSLKTRVADFLLGAATGLVLSAVIPNA